MKSDPARHTAKSLLGLFSTAVMLAILHLISRHFKKVFNEEYVKSYSYSTCYKQLQRFIDFFMADHTWFNMRFGIPPGTEVVTQHGPRRSRFCTSRGIGERLITDFSCHYESGRSDNLSARVGGVLTQETLRGRCRAPITADQPERMKV